MNSFFDDFNAEMQKYLAKKRIADRVKELELNEHDLFAIRNIIWMMFNEDDETSELLTNIHFDGQDYVAVKYPNPKFALDVALSNVITLGYFNESFNNDKTIRADIGNRKQLAIEMKKYFEDYNNMKRGIYLSGVRGAGKTLLIKTLVIKLIKMNKKVGFVNTSQLWDFVNSKETKRQNALPFIKNMLQTVEVLFIDDIGGEVISPELRDEFLFSVLNFRAESQKLTFFTSAFSQKELVDIQSKTQSKYIKARDDKDRAVKLVNKIKELAKEFHLTNESFFDIE